jgi:multicomponent Na+:H+ antiporter subunit C
MQLLLAIAVGGLVTAGIYQMLQRSLVRLIIGLVLLGHAANLLVFTVSGLIHTRAPYVDRAGNAPPDATDPLPQALILTAIVIGLGTQAFAIVLIHRTYQIVATDDLRKLTATDAMPK